MNKAVGANQLGKRHATLNRGFIGRRILTDQLHLDWQFSSCSGENTCHRIKVVLYGRVISNYPFIPRERV